MGLRKLMLLAFALMLSSQGANAGDPNQPDLGKRNVAAQRFDEAKKHGALCPRLAQKALDSVDREDQELGEAVMSSVAPKGGVDRR